MKQLLHGTVCRKKAAGISVATFLFGMVLTMPFSDNQAQPNTAEVKTVADSIIKLPVLNTAPPPVVWQHADFPKDLTEQEQADLLIYAYNVAKADGFEDPTYLQALIWQESHAGGYEGHEVAGDEYGLRVGKRYYGVGQIKVAAAKDVFKRFPDEFPGFYEKPIKVKLANGKTKIIPGRYLMDDEEIIAHLITDKRFNIRVASKYLWIMQHKEKRGKVVYVRPINYAVTAYNRGLGNTYKTKYNEWHYTVSVNEYRNSWIPIFNKQNEAHLDIVEPTEPEPTTTAKAGGV